MNNQQTALRLALEALEYWDVHGKLHQPTEEAITAIKQALEQPVQEPVALEMDGKQLTLGEALDEAIAATERSASKRLNAVLVAAKNALYTTPPAAAVQPVAMRMPKVGDRVVCIDDESLGTVVYLTAGGSPEIKFDDDSHGTYMLREFAELFGYTTPPAQEFVCSTGLCHYKPAAAVQSVIEMIDAILKEHSAAQLLAVQEPVCHICKGTGEMDHGGTYPWGEAINIPCECTTPPAAVVAWQHIESAPKDGTRILCQNEKGLVDICEWTEDRFTSSDDRTFGGHLAYTSWMPLPHSNPTPPAAQPAQKRHVSYVCPQCHWSLEKQPAPVHFAWMRYEEDCAGDPVLVLSRSTEEGAFRVYKEPAQRKWVGLSQDELDAMFSNTIIKEKNT